MYLLPDDKRREVWSAYKDRDDVKSAARVLCSVTDDGAYRHTFSALQRNWLNIQALEAEDNVISKVKQQLCAIMRQENNLLNQYGKSVVQDAKSTLSSIDYFQTVADRCEQRRIAKNPFVGDDERLANARERVIEHTAKLGSFADSLVHYFLNSRSAKAELTAKLEPYDLELNLQTLTSRQDEIELMVSPIEDEVYDALVLDGVTKDNIYQTHSYILRIIGKKCLDVSVARFTPAIVESDVGDEANTRVLHSATLLPKTEDSLVYRAV